MHHQLGGSTEDDMNKMSVIGHISLTSTPKCWRTDECTEKECICTEGLEIK
jgi:hypothetical protein